MHRSLRSSTLRRSTVRDTDPPDQFFLDDPGVLISRVPVRIYTTLPLQSLRRSRRLPLVLGEWRFHNVVVPLAQHLQRHFRRLDQLIGQEFPARYPV